MSNCDHSQPPEPDGNGGWEFACGHAAPMPTDAPPVQPRPGPASEVESAFRRWVSDDATRLDELLGVLRKHGVSRYKCDEYEVELVPLDMVECGACGRTMLSKVLGGHRCPVAGPQAAQAAAGTDAKRPEDVCPCGHSRSIEHSDGGCLNGCAHALCASEDATPEPA